MVIRDIDQRYDKWLTRTYAKHPWLYFVLGITVLVAMAILTVVVSTADMQ